VAGLLAAALTAAAPFLVWYAQEARTYALVALLCGAATVRFLDALEDPSRRHLVQWGLLAALGLGAHYFAGFLLIPQAVVLVWRLRARALPGVAFPLAAGLALLPLLLAQRDNGVDWVSESSLASRVADVAKHWVAGPFGTPADALGALGVAVLGAGALLALSHARGRLLGGVIAAALAGPVALALLGEDYVLDRYLIGALVPLIALAAAGFAQAGRPAAVAGAALALLFTGFTVATVLDEELHREDWRALAERLPEGPLAIVVTRDGEPPLDVYVERGAPLTERIEVREVVTAASHRFGRARPATPPAPAGFRVLERREGPTTTVVRYGAKAPVAVDAAALAPLALDVAEPPALIARPTP
jgi:mannosyltransferase